MVPISRATFTLHAKQNQELSFQNVLIETKFEVECEEDTAAFGYVLINTPLMWLPVWSILICQSIPYPFMARQK